MRRADGGASSCLVARHWAKQVYHSIRFGFGFSFNKKNNLKKCFFFSYWLTLGKNDDDDV